MRPSNARASMTLKPVHLETLFVPAGSDVLLDVEPEEPGSVRIGISGNTPAQATFRLPAGGSITCPACGDEIGMGSFRTRAASGAAVSVVGTKATQVQLDCSECPGTPLPDRPVPRSGAHLNRQSWRRRVGVHHHERPRSAFGHGGIARD